MLKTKGKIQFKKYGSEPQCGYDPVNLLRLDFMTSDNMSLMGSIDQNGSIDIYEYEKEYQVEVNFIDIDEDVVSQFPQLTENIQNYSIHLGNKTIGYYSTDKVELV